MTTGEAINAAVFEVTCATIKNYCETRIGQGATREQVNTELKDYLPKINQWSRRQRRLLKAMLDEPIGGMLQ
jgi:hypothetical protein